MAAVAAVVLVPKARGVARTQIEHSGLRLPAGGTSRKVSCVVCTRIHGMDGLGGDIHELHTL